MLIENLVEDRTCRIVPVLKQWVHEVRPLMGAASHPALWVTEQCGRIARRGVNEAFEVARSGPGLYPQRFVQDQVGHIYASTTAIYTGVSDEYRTRLLHRALEKHREDLWRARS